MTEKQQSAKKEEPTLDRVAYSVPEIASRLGCSPRSVCREIHTGKLRHIRVGRRVLVTEQALQEYLKKCLVKVS